MSTVLITVLSKVLSSYDSVKLPICFNFPLLLQLLNLSTWVCETHHHQCHLLYPFLWHYLRPCALRSGYPWRTLLPTILDRSWRQIISFFSSLLFLGHYPSPLPQTPVSLRYMLSAYLPPPVFDIIIYEFWATLYPIHWHFKQLHRSLP